jgi:peptidoglycan-associated lipoprotein
MKARIGFKLLVFVLALTCIAAVGCRKKPVGVTPLPNAKFGQVPEAGPGGILPGDNTGINTQPGTTAGGIAQGDHGQHAGWAEDHDTFKADIVYFDFDKSAIKSTEQSKLEAVGDYLKNNSAAAVRVEGNCDERGTEEYNRALGERRALAAREYLVHLGIGPDRVDTISYGEDKPAETGHDEAAWKKNRRDEFVLLTAPK